jgi:hypothetical protein
MSNLKWILIAAAFLFSACKQGTPTVTYTPPVLADDWSVRLTQSGGIMGLLRNIEVRADGKFAANDERAGTTVTGELTVGELTELQRLAAEMTFTAPRIPAVCADCFVYEIQIESGGKKMIAQADDISLPDSGMALLVEFLRGIMDSALR